nr:phospholipid-transporting ATPase 2 isoform X1 [Tanacetum cinerariifolium]
MAEQQALNIQTHPSLTLILIPHLTMTQSTMHSYAFEKSEMEEFSMVALCGCVWLQAFIVTLETKQPAYWNTMFLIVAAGTMGTILAMKNFRYTYRSSKINILQQADHLGGQNLTLGNIKPQPRSSLDTDLAPMSISQSKNGR